MAIRIRDLQGRLAGQGQMLSGQGLPGNLQHAAIDVGGRLAVQFQDLQAPGQGDRGPSRGGPEGMGQGDAEGQAGLDHRHQKAVVVNLAARQDVIAFRAPTIRGFAPHDGEPSLGEALQGFQDLEAMEIGSAGRGRGKEQREGRLALAAQQGLHDVLPAGEIGGDFRGGDRLNHRPIPVPGDPAAHCHLHAQIRGGQRQHHHRLALDAVADPARGAGANQRRRAYHLADPPEHGLRVIVGRSEHLDQGKGMYFDGLQGLAGGFFANRAGIFSLGHSKADF